MSYVVAAYGVTLVALGLYAASLWREHVRLSRDEE